MPSGTQASANRHFAVALINLRRHQTGKVDGGQKENEPCDGDHRGNGIQMAARRHLAVGLRLKVQVGKRGEAKFHRQIEVIVPMPRSNAPDVFRC